LTGCHSASTGEFDAGVYWIAYTGCFDGPFACARACFQREIALAVSAASADVARACALDCASSYRPELRSCFTPDKLISLVACLAALTEVPEPDADSGAAPESCAAACFEGWR
jgi:hypothetical protein